MTEQEIAEEKGKKLSRNQVWELLKHYTDYQVSSDCVDTAHDRIEASIKKTLERCEEECAKKGGDHDSELKEKTIIGDQFATWWNMLHSA